MRELFQIIKSGFLKGIPAIGADAPKPENMSFKQVVIRQVAKYLAIFISLWIMAFLMKCTGIKADDIVKLWGLF